MESIRLYGKKHGSEVLPIQTVKIQHPAIVTADVKKFYVLRCGSGDYRIIGVRNGRVLEIIWYDTDLSLYPH